MHELSKTGKICYYSLSGIRFTGICIILFLYICSLSNISTAFTLLGSRGIGDTPGLFVRREDHHRSCVKPFVSSTFDCKIAKHSVQRRVQWQQWIFLLIVAGTKNFWLT
uniref:Secreted protein n=1 Tax=Angiostrongylus cantonensis TaxID=6313 RepID=A0A0K0D5Q5_ANGCA